MLQQALTIVYQLNFRDVKPTFWQQMLLNGFCYIFITEQPFNKNHTIASYL